jgi:hypothetical protein
MKANLSGAMRTHDFEQLDRGLTRLAALAPDAMPDWTRLAQAGRVAVHARDLTAIRGACVACHEQYRRRYRAEMRARPLAQAEIEAE